MSATAIHVVFEYSTSIGNTRALLLAMAEISDDWGRVTATPQNIMSKANLTHKEFIAACNNAICMMELMSDTYTPLEDIDIEDSLSFRLMLVMTYQTEVQHREARSRKVKNV